jgi:CRP-like cAMP-binding protein
LLPGIAARQKDMRDGKRQITEIHVPGDFTDMHSFTLKSLDHDVVALSDCSFAVVPHAQVQHITETQPHLTRV